MPELPEVETVRRQLEPVLVGQTIQSVEVLREKSWDGEIDQVVGSEIEAVERKAKVIFIELRAKNQESRYLMIHLKMTGQLIYEPRVKSQESRIKRDSNTKPLLTHQPINPSTRIVGGHPNNSWTNELPDKHTRVIIKLSQGTLFFNDQRVFGWVRLATSDKIQATRAGMPPDIIDSECDQEYFYKVLQSSGRAVKVLIMDSKKIGGVGNIYACDGLFDAGIDPRREAKNLTRLEADRLLASLKKVVNKSIKLGGATAADGKFVNTSGLGGKYQDEFLVYEQEGVIVEKNGKKGVVEKFKLGGRGTYWVPKLQS
jgi:formamidopyrimidine-DNA glycosylase